jgi:hypothetical protein
MERWPQVRGHPNTSDKEKRRWTGKNRGRKGARRIQSGELSRRGLLRGAAASAVIGAAGSASAQLYGSMEGGGTVPLRLPAGVLDYLDRKDYIHNMEVHAHLPGAALQGGEPLTGFWAKGATPCDPVRGRLPRCD